MLMSIKNGKNADPDSAIFYLLKLLFSSTVTELADQARRAVSACGTVECPAKACTVLCQHIARTAFSNNSASDRR